MAENKNVPTNPSSKPAPSTPKPIPASKPIAKTYNNGKVTTTSSSLPPKKS